MCRRLLQMLTRHHRRLPCQMACVLVAAWLCACYGSPWWMMAAGMVE